MQDLSHWNMLIVDDEPDNIGVLELVFRFHQAKVRVAESGPQCLKMMEEESPSLMLLDIHMPGMSGYELLKIIRDDVRWQNIPIIAVTAYAMNGDDERILATGFDGYIAKPVSAMTIADEVKTIVDAKKVH
jgi:two-component system, cell cycle response regulator DivK